MDRTYPTYLFLQHHFITLNSAFHHPVPVGNEDIGTSFLQYIVRVLPGASAILWTGSFASTSAGCYIPSPT